jgi:hypothetical protein
MMMMMKNLLCAAALLAFGGIGLASSANALPAASVTGISDKAASSVEQVHFRRHHRFFSRFYWGSGFYSYDYPYSWKCRYYRFGY